MRRALPAVLITATGVAALLRSQSQVDASASPPTPPDASAPAGEGSITGQAVTTMYGAIQVAAVMQGTQLAEVRAVQAPSDNPTSQRINSMALPVLRQEALTAQSARIDTVAGATFTSDAYRRSLQSAIDALGQGTATTPSTTAGSAPPGTVAGGPAPTTTTPANASPSTTVLSPPTTVPAGNQPAPPATVTTIADGPVVPIATGPVQARVTVSGGHITQVEITQYPTGNPTSASLNNNAVPKLHDAVLSAQSAKGVAAVSGATLTSKAFLQSLQAALDSVHFAG
jgi:uncharacterized protein with FMN-binding domain